jgi:hypothetical protein
MLKGIRFEDTEDSKRNVTKELFALNANEFRKRFQQFYDSAQKCVTSQGGFILMNIKGMFNFKCAFLKIYAVLELNSLTFYLYV